MENTIYLCLKTREFIQPGYHITALLSVTMENHNIVLKNVKKKDFTKEYLKNVEYDIAEIQEEYLKNFASVIEPVFEDFFLRPGETFFIWADVSVISLLLAKAEKTSFTVPPSADMEGKLGANQAIAFLQMEKKKDIFMAFQVFPVKAPEVEAEAA